MGNSQDFPHEMGQDNFSQRQSSSGPFVMKDHINFKDQDSRDYFQISSSLMAHCQRV